MKSLKIIIKSNNKKASVQFMSFLNEKLKNNKFILQKICLKTLNKNQFTILKSPNINKTAQEKFEIKNLNTQIMFVVTKFIYYLHFLKQLSQNYSSDCAMFLKYKIICKKYNLMLRQTMFNPVIIKSRKYNNQGRTTNIAFWDFNVRKSPNFFNFAIALVVFFKNQVEFRQNKILFLLKVFSISGEFFKKIN